jgi:L-iditol 2-dehydrogenase
MLAAVYRGPNDLRLEEWPIPAIGPDEALVKVVSVGICGTDLRIVHGEHRKFPPGTVRIPGHEVVGDLVQIGADVIGLTVGQRVMVAPNFGCGHCDQCVSGNNNRCANYGALGVTMDGAFAEYMRIPAPMIWQGDLIPIAPETNPAGAALIEPLACVLRGQTPLAIGPDDVVLVIVSEMQPARMPQALASGADRAVNALEEDLAAVISEESQGEGADVIIVAAPAHKAQEEALRLAAIGGRINFFGGLPKDRSLNSTRIGYITENCRSPALPHAARRTAGRRRGSSIRGASISRNLSAGTFP